LDLADEINSDVLKKGLEFCGYKQSTETFEGNPKG